MGDDGYDALCKAFSEALARADGRWADEAALAEVLEAADQVLCTTFNTSATLAHASETIRLIGPLAKARSKWAPHATRKQLKAFDCAWLLNTGWLARQEAEASKSPPPTHDEILAAFGGRDDVRVALLALDDLLSTAHDGAFFEYDDQFDAFLRDARTACPSLARDTLEKLAELVTGRAQLPTALDKKAKAKRSVRHPAKANATVAAPKRRQSR